MHMGLRSGGSQLGRDQLPTAQEATGYGQPVILLCFFPEVGGDFGRTWFLSDQRFFLSQAGWIILVLLLLQSVFQRDHTALHSQQDGCRGHDAR